MGLTKLAFLGELILKKHFHNLFRSPTQIFLPHILSILLSTDCLEWELLGKNTCCTVKQWTDQWLIKPAHFRRSTTTNKLPSFGKHCGCTASGGNWAPIMVFPVMSNLLTLSISELLSTQKKKILNSNSELIYRPAPNIDGWNVRASATTPKHCPPRT